MFWPQFALRNVSEVLVSPDETTDSELDSSKSRDRADASESSSFGSSRITDWARACGKCLGKEELGEFFNGRQVGSELDYIFRETPSFGRSLAERLGEYHRSDTNGPWQMIGGGGEAVVFFDEETQDVIKLFSLFGKAKFGWEVVFGSEGNRNIVPGSLEAALLRYCLAEENFPCGMDIEAVADDGSFLLMRQPFFLGENPYPKDLHKWMKRSGWSRCVPETESRMVNELSWRRDDVIATDVRPENVICSAADGDFYSIDFIMTGA